MADARVEKIIELSNRVNVAKTALREYLAEIRAACPLKVGQVVVLRSGLPYHVLEIGVSEHECVLRDRVCYDLLLAPDVKGKPGKYKHLHYNYTGEEKWITQ